jgi:hypothetical protein
LPACLPACLPHTNVIPKMAFDADSYYFLERLCFVTMPTDHTRDNADQYVKQIKNSKKIYSDQPYSIFSGYETEI